MPSDQPPSSNRRDFVTGTSLRSELEHSSDVCAESLLANDEARCEPIARDTIRLSTRAMACDFAVILNPAADSKIEVASEALELVHQLEDQMSVYRHASELSLLNQNAVASAVEVEKQLFKLLQLCKQLCVETSAAFDPTSGPLVALWRQCRKEGRIPDENEMSASLDRTGIEHVRLDETVGTVAFDQAGTELNLGGIGKAPANRTVFINTIYQYFLAAANFFLQPFKADISL